MNVIRYEGSSARRASLAAACSGVAGSLSVSGLGGLVDVELNWWNRTAAAGRLGRKCDWKKGAENGRAAELRALSEELASHDREAMEATLQNRRLEAVMIKSQCKRLLVENVLLVVVVAEFADGRRTSC